MHLYHPWFYKFISETRKYLSSPKKISLKLQRGALKTRSGESGNKSQSETNQTASRILRAHEQNGETCWNWKNSGMKIL